MERPDVSVRAIVLIAVVTLVAPSAVLPAEPAGDRAGGTDRLPGQDGAEPVPRVVLAELFTGSECPPCTAADLAFDRILEEFPRDEVVVLEYHVDIPSQDPMSVATNDDRLDYYGAGRSAPQAYIGGDREYVGQGGPRQRTGRYFTRVTGLIDEAREEGSRLRLRASAVLGFTEGRAEVRLEPLVPLEGEYRVHLVLYQDKIEYTGANRVQVHRCVVRDMLLGIDGEAVELDGEPRTLAASFSREMVDVAEIGVVAFVQERGSRRVLQAQVVEIDDRVPDAVELHNAGVRLAQAGQLQEALESLRAAVELDPEAPTAHFTLGLAYAGLRRLGDAAGEWERVLELDPGQAEVHLRLSFLYEEIGERQDAVRHLEAFLEKSPDHPQAEAQRQRLSRLKG